jgi:uncharacterized protein
MPETNLSIVKKFKAQALKRIDVAKMIFFGSRANGGFTKDSDFDLLVVSKDFNGIKKSKRSPSLHMTWGFDYPVDLLCYTPNEFRRSLNGINIASEAARKGILV